MPIPDGTTFGRYEIKSQLGSGGMGEVYRAYDSALQRTVALKLLPATFTRDQDRVRRFINEARAASSLNHPNILTIHDIGETDTSCFMATELVDGETLRKRLARGPLPLRDVLEITMQVCAGLSAAHGAGIVHRDIKPENVMIRPDGLVKLLDFGLAKLVETAETHAPSGENAATMIGTKETDVGIVMGTVVYMSPEQARGVKLDSRTDTFSLGVMLYEMIAGRAPFTGETNTDVLVSVIEREPPSLRQHATGVPAQLDWIVSKALEKSPDLRYQTISDFRVDLLRLQKGLDSGRLHEPESAIAPPLATPVAPALTDDHPRVIGLTRFSTSSVVLVVAAVIAASVIWPLYRSTPSAALEVSLPRAAVPVKAREIAAGFGYDVSALVDNVHFSTTMRLSDTVKAEGLESARRAIREGAGGGWRDVLVAKSDDTPVAGVRLDDLKPGQFSIWFGPSGQFQSFFTPPRSAEPTPELQREEAIAKGEELLRTKLSLDPRGYQVEFNKRTFPPQVVDIVWRKPDLVFGHREVALVQFQGNRVTRLGSSLNLAVPGSDPPVSPWVKRVQFTLSTLIVVIVAVTYGFGIVTFVLRRRWDMLVDRLPLVVTLVFSCGTAVAILVTAPTFLQSLLAIVVMVVMLCVTLPAAAGLVPWMQASNPERLFGFEQLVRGRLRSRAVAATIVHGFAAGLVIAGFSTVATALSARITGYVPGIDTSLIDVGTPLAMALAEAAVLLGLAGLLAFTTEMILRFLRRPAVALACAGAIYAFGAAGFGGDLSLGPDGTAFGIELVAGMLLTWIYYTRGFGALWIALAVAALVENVIHARSFGEPQLVFHANVLLAVLGIVLLLGVWGYAAGQIKKMTTAMTGAT